MNSHQGLTLLLLSSVLACGSSSTSSGSDNTTGSSGSSNGSSGTSTSGSGASPSSGSANASGIGGSSGGNADAGPTGMGVGSDATAPEGGSASSGGGTDATAGGACTRAALTAAINAYFTALAAHDPTMAPLSSTAKYTENGKVVQVGQGEWKTAGAVKFKRSALDTEICNSVTEAVIADSSGDLVYGLRLKLDNQKITEIETIPVVKGSYIIISASGLEASSTDDWETVLPTGEQGTRAELQSLMDTYFTRFPNGACNFASDCMRMEDGSSAAGSCTGSGIGCTDSGSGTGGMTARLHVIDVEAGISVGFTMFAGTYTDFHMFKVRGGQVHSVHAVLSSASSSGWQ